MKRKLPPLNSLRTFEAIGRHGSIVRAAGELNVTEPAVSRALKNLENHFGVNLFHRDARGLTLSEHGKILLPDITNALNQVASAAGRVYEQSRHSITILATPVISSRWIAPVIGEFMQENPDISVHLHSSFRQSEIQSYKFDIGIWNFECDHADCDREPFFSVNRIPISSAKMAKAKFQDGDLKALENTSLLHEFDFSDWMEWFENNDLNPRHAACGFVSDNFSAIQRATISGAGVGLLFDTFLDDPVLGHLVAAPFGISCAVATEYWLYSNATVVDDKPVRKMRNFLMKRFGRS